MPATAFALALTAAFVHALWNILLARARDIESATAVALITAELVFAPVAVLTWDVDPADKMNNHLIALVIGLSTWETVDIMHKGANYGYSLREGPQQLKCILQRVTLMNHAVQA